MHHRRPPETPPCTPPPPRPARPRPSRLTAPLTAALALGLLCAPSAPAAQASAPAHPAPAVAPSGQRPAIPAPAALPAAKAAAIKKTALRTTTALNLRKGASAASKKLGTIPRNTALSSTFRAANGWYKVSHRGKTGYVSDRYVKATAATPAPAAAKKVAGITIGTRQSLKGLGYAVLDGGVNAKKPVGVMIYLDGDYYPGYTSAVSQNPGGAKAKAMAKVAAKRNLLLVIPRHVSAGYTRSMGFTWWYKSATTAPYLRRLDAALRKAGKIPASGV